MFDKTIINRALDSCRDAVEKSISNCIARKRSVPGAYQGLYDLLADYPFRKGKSLRPTLCIAMARAIGGYGHAALISSTALELYHNAFLIHDDVEDGSEQRRGRETLHELVGIPRAVNVGDATNVLAVSLLLENLGILGVAKAMNILHEIENMARQSVEGQAMELDWVANNAYNLGDHDYFMMCVKKTCWYTFIAPCRIGYIAGCSTTDEHNVGEHLAAITEFGQSLGIAFQIQDDLLNLQGELSLYGKEIGGDIYEGKRTIMLNHLLCNAGKSAARIRRILALPRTKKKITDIQFILDQMELHGSFAHAKKIAFEQSEKAMCILDKLTFLLETTPRRPQEHWETEEVDRRFIKELVNYVIDRNL